jgi:major membrane immunogen (membrane-anchored lipoprotein)
MRKYGMVALFAAASLVAACSQADDGSPTAAENEQLNNISEVLDTSADSLVPEDSTLGNGEAPAETGELPVVSNEVANDAASNGQ